MTFGLLAIGRENWAMLDGHAVGHGFDPSVLPLDRYCSFVHWWVVRDRDPDEVRKFETKLWKPPKGVAATVGPWSPEAEAGSFAAIKAGLGMKGPTTRAGQAVPSG